MESTQLFEIAERFADQWLHLVILNEKTYSIKNAKAEFNYDKHGFTYSESDMHPILRLAELDIHQLKDLIETFPKFYVQFAKAGLE